jgi:predicted amidohydrolase
MKVGLIQLSAGTDKATNIIRARSLVQKAVEAGAEFILLPEVFNYRGPLSGSELYHQIAEEIPGKSIIPFMEMAKQNAVHILAGSIYERKLGGEKIYNTSVMIDDSGNIIGKYRKINLFKAVIEGQKIDESETYEHGKEPVLCGIKNKKIGLSICFDLRFPELYRNYFKEKVDLIVIPSSFSQKTGELHWKPLLRARAIENYCYVLAPNQFGIDGNGVETYGNSMVIDPQGIVIATLEKKREDILIVNLILQERVFYPLVQA